MKRKLSCEISVIIAVYNQEKLIGEAIQSALNQVDVDLEIICVNDGSTDQTEKVIEEYIKKDKRVFLINQPNMGEGLARNAGINAARGEYIVFLDSDDFFLDSDALGKMYRAAKKNNSKIVGGHIEILRTNGMFDKAIKYVFEQICFDERVYYYDDIQLLYGITAFIYSTDLLIEYNIKFPSYIRNQDCPFQVQAMYFANEIIFVDTKLYCIRDREKKAQSVFKEDAINDTVQGFSDIIDFASEKNLSKLVYQCLGEIYINNRIAIKKFLNIELVNKLLHVRNVVLSYFGWDTVYLDILQELIDITRANVCDANELSGELNQLITSDCKFYIYGAGNTAKYLLSYLSDENLIERVIKILVSSKEGNPVQIEGIQVFDFYDLKDFDNSIPLVMCVSGSQCYQLIESIVKKGIKKIIFIDATDISWLRDRYMKNDVRHFDSIRV